MAADAMRRVRAGRRYSLGVPYEVATPVFEGPFDLLLHLITKEQVDIYEVSLSSIVDAYVRTIEDMGVLDLEIATEFLLIAAILIELKTRRLLPGRDDGELDDEFGLWEERDLLIARLLECQTFKDAAAALDRLAARASRSYPRTAGLESAFLGLVPDLLAGVTPADLHAAFIRAVTPKPRPKVDLDHVAPIRISVGEAAEELAAELPAMGPTTFRRITAGMASRLHIIVRFLALLELYKRGAIDLEQGDAFGDLHIVWLGTDGASVTEGIEEYSG
jgi:segregation and condensation protein A